MVGIFPDHRLFSCEKTHHPNLAKRIMKVQKIRIETSNKNAKDPKSKIERTG